MKKRVYLLIILITFYLPGLAQGNFWASVDKQRILIGEKIQLKLQAVFPKATPVYWIHLDTLPHFEIMEQSKVDTELVSKGISLLQTITLTSWDSGKWTIPAFTIPGAKTKPILIEVGYTPMAPNQPYNEIKEIVEVQRPVESNWYWYFIGAALLIALFVLFFPGEKKKREVVVPISPVDVYKNALARIDRLQIGDEPKYLYTELINIFREYLEKRKSIQSFSKTTDDLSVQITKLNIAAKQHQLLQTLRLSDMVKFARYHPSPEENRNSIEVIKKSIIEIENAEVENLKLQTNP